MRRPSLHIWLWIKLVILSVTSALAQQSTGLLSLSDPDYLRGWEAVGRVDVHGTGYCTGVLIAPDLVLTAAHCVYDEMHQVRPVHAIQFRTGLTNGASLADRAILRVVPHKSFDPRAALSMDTIRFDVALLELTEPVPDTLAHPFVIHQSPDHGQKVSVASYGAGRENTLSLQRNCSVLGENPFIIAFDCDVTFGSSGAPVFVHDGPRRRILTLISGGGISAAYGMRLLPRVAELKNDLRKIQQAVPAVGMMRSVPREE